MRVVLLLLMLRGACCYLPGVNHPLVHQNECSIVSVIYQVQAIPCFINMSAFIMKRIFIRSYIKLKNIIIRSGVGVSPSIT